MSIDLTLTAKLYSQSTDFGRGFDVFLRLLATLRAAPGFDVDWFAQLDEGSEPLFVFKNREAYEQVFRDFNGASPGHLSLWAHSPDPRLYDLRYDCSDLASSVDQASLDVRAAHPEHGADLEFCLGALNAFTLWQRPMHVRFGPFVYVRDDHPLDRSREGISWIGWLPFDLSPSDVPEAEIVRPMNEGTLVATQRAFWQAWPQHPAYSRTAIERTQEVELRLNRLGVLPTSRELERGDWGR